MIAKSVMCIQPPKVEEFGGKLAVYADPHRQTEGRGACVPT